MKKQNLNHKRTCVYNVNYHIVFSTKYRKKVLCEKVEEYLKKLIDQIAKDKGFYIEMIEVGQQDHVHVFVSADPNFSISYIVKMIKGISARKLLLFFPFLTKLLWKGHLWNPSYYVETIGSISEESIKKYIEGQKK
jgi:putative transposase